uniref:Helitron helicase-like domain-containing protein n=1 Tax=Mycena chlorophos TaxID=658473 RepID=A0ABQ0L8T6_MYCCL|nr:predicted protein [Mycena chlorophos]
MILASLINITFVGTKKKPLQVLPKLFQVRRKRVFDALIWLKNNNPLYAPLEISEADLVALREEGLPDEILVNLRYSDDVQAALKEHGGYIPLDEENGATSSNTHSEPSDEKVNEPDPLFDMLPADFVVLPNNVDRMAENIERRLAEDLLAEDTQPDVFPLYSNGVLDLNGSEITDSDIFSHGVENIVPGPIAIDYGVRKGSAFISEYARVDDEGERFDGGPTNPNLLLGAHPVLFPYAAGGIEVDREEDVTFEAHVQWALEYGDKRFRKDLLFTFQVFSILQRRRICRSTCVQARASDFLANSHLFEKLRPRDLILASREEARRMPFSNPAVQLLRKQLTTVRACVMGTDESRVSIRAQIWGMTLRFNPPSIWMTINFADVADPIAQVLAGENLNLDDFLSTASMKTSQERSQIIAADPFAAAEFFHHFVKTLLVNFFGIDVSTRGNIKRQTGALGIVNGYVGVVEAQARGSLHLHLLL